jgi:glycosyltransferase involved in cell wall biosynthesis
MRIRVGKLRVLQVHNYYRSSGGEDTVVSNEQALLAQSGHDVALYSVHNSEIASLFRKTKTFINVRYNRAARAKLSGYLASYRPDVVHVHNFFPLLSPSVYDAMGEASIPVVQTLHNYRTFCAGATLFRNGQACELCLDGYVGRAVLHRCYRGSVLGSMAAAHMIGSHRRRGTWSHAADRYIVLTEFARSKFIQAGFPPERIVIKPNFVPDPGFPPAQVRTGALYVGRLSPEKGIVPLLRAWRGVDYHLSILGDGPELMALRREAHHTVSFEGQVGANRVKAAMQSALFLVVPSLWYEGLPMTVIEAFANGLPVIASRIGSLPELIEDGVTGVLFQPGNSDALAAVINTLLSDPTRLSAMSAAARRRYEALYTPEKNRDLILSIYQEAIANAHKLK